MLLPKLVATQLKPIDKPAGFLVKIFERSLAVWLAMQHCCSRLTSLYATSQCVCTLMIALYGKLAQGAAASHHSVSLWVEVAAYNIVGMAFQSPKALPSGSIP